MPTTAKYPTTLLALTDLGAEFPDAGAPTELTLNGAITAAALTFVVNEAIPASWPATGWVKIDSETLHYSAYNAGTKTFTVDVRGAQTTYGSGAAAAHTDTSTVGYWVTAQALNQMAAELVAIEAQLGVNLANSAPVYPNLIPNSDFVRRTVLPGSASFTALAMPEAFTDVTGQTAVEGTLGTVAANVLTAGTNGTWSAKSGLTIWRDGRWSALCKQNGTGTTNVGRIGIGKSDGAAWTANNGVFAVYFRTAASTVTLELIKVIAGVTTVVASVASLTFTDTHVGWVELDAQGQTYTAKLYTQASTTPGLKSAATLLGTAQGQITDAGVVAGTCHLVNGSGVGAATIWGGLSASPGGVYVETPLPESWTVTFGGTLGGQAVGIDEAADSGPLTKQKVPVVFIPVASRTVTLAYSGPDGQMNNSAAYTASYYEKNTALGGSGVMIRASLLEQNSASATQATTNTDDAAETVFTRKTSTVTTNAATRRFAWQFLINPSSTRTGTVRFSLPQLELGSSATAWRNAPADLTSPFTLPYKFVNWAATTTFVWSDAPIQPTVMHGNTTVAFTGPLTAPMQLHLIQDQTGSRVPTLPATVKFPSGTTPTWSTVAGKRDIVTLIPTGDGIQATAAIGF